MSIEGDTSNLRAPEERNVYRTVGRDLGILQPSETGFKKIHTIKDQT